MNVILGDIHGGYDVIVKYIKTLRNDYDVTEHVNIIQVGDFGIGFETDSEEKSLLKKLDKRLVDYNGTAYIMRGNHDDPKFFRESEAPSWLSECKNINFVEDYTTHTIEGVTYLFIGGAVSIDRFHLTPNDNWWEDEPVDKTRINDLPTNPIDVVITHNSPINFEPMGGVQHQRVAAFNKGANYSRGDLNGLIMDLNSEREYLYEVFKRLNFKRWYYGHYHYPNEFYLDDRKIKLLGIMEFIVDSY